MNIPFRKLCATLAAASGLLGAAASQAAESAFIIPPPAVDQAKDAAPQEKAVIEDVSQMAAAVGAMDGGADHAEAAVPGFAHGGGQRLPEAGPAGAAVEFGAGREQPLFAARAGERAIAVFIVQRAGVGPFGALAAQRVELRGRQALSLIHI